MSVHRSLAAAFVLTTALAAPPAAAAEPGAAPVVRTTRGAVRGTAGEVLAFKGIP
jgi:hypothetical protein